MNYKTLIYPLVLSLSACSDIPSESDIEDSLAKIYSECKSMNIVDVEKTNGMVLDNGNYQVSTVFSLELEPLKENTELGNNFLKNSEIYHQVQGKYDKEYDNLNERYYSFKDSSYKKLLAAKREDYASIKKWRDEKLNIFSTDGKDITKRNKEELNKLGLENFGKKSISGLVQQQLFNLDKVCSVRKSKLGDRLLKDIIGIKAFGGYSYKEQAKVLAEETVVEFSTDLEMVKTENGWQYIEI